jgi:hypothetical protein
MVRMTVREPVARDVGDVPGLRAVLRYLVRERAIFAPHMLGYAFSGWALFAMLAWGPAVLMRGFGMSAAEAGLRLGVVAILAGGGAPLPAAGCWTGSRAWGGRTQVFW